MDAIESHMLNLFNTVKNDPVLFYAIVASLVVVFLTSIVLIYLRRRRTFRDGVLIVGLSDSGKTLLFSKLVSAKTVTTYTSMKENISTVVIPSNKKKVRLIDVPGNERLRTKFLDEYLETAKGIMFVVDSLNFQKEIKDVASFLYSLLQEGFVQRNSIPILVVCNKQDHAVAKSAKIMQSQLEKEMNALRLTQTGKLNATSPDEENIFLGQKGKDFQFADLKPIKVEFSECSALETGEGDASTILPQMWTWMAKIA